MEKLVCVDDFTKVALEKLGKNEREYFATGADDEITTQQNIFSFTRWIIRPRVLRDVSKRDLSTMILGKKVSIPLGISPVAFQRLVNKDGECASVKAAEAVGGIMILSFFATTSFDELTAIAPNSRRWMQFFIHKDRSITEGIIRRAEKAGFEAIVVTVDAQYVGNRRSSKRNPLEFPAHLKLPNGGGVEKAELSIFELHDIMDHGVTWPAISWVKSVSKLPVVVKGIQVAEDAELAVQYGADAVFLSNHGGRQIDTARSTIDVLPEIVKAVGHKCEIYIDGGVRRGSDIFKALALGANMVFVGRPIIWGLAVNGASGATKVLEILRDELDLTMALTGTAKISDINKDYVQQYTAQANL